MNTDDTLNLARDISHLRSITEYANDCGVVRNTIHTRIKKNKHPMPTLSVDVLELESLFEADVNLRYARPTLYKGVLDAVAKGRPEMVMIDSKKYPPKRQKSGPKAKPKKKVGPHTRNAITYAHLRGWVLERLSAKYRLTPGPKLQGEGEIMNMKNLSQVYAFLRPLPVIEVDSVKA